MASLLERLSIPTDGPGPVRSKPNSRGPSPYARANRPPKGDVNSAWSHDLFEDPSRSLSARLSLTTTVPKANINAIAQKALRDATASSGGLTIKGASSSGNVVQVEGLVEGTSPADVEAIFKQCGPVIHTRLYSTDSSAVTIRVTYKTPSAAQVAVQKFDGQTADGRTLKVWIVGAAGASLVGRLGSGDSMDLVREEGSVDALMEANSTGSKMRSDSLVSDPRSQVLVAPPGTNPADYLPNNRRGGVGRGRGRGGRRGRGRRGGMDID